jgi:hypothetical protein
MDESKLDKFETDVANPGNPDKPRTKSSSYGSDTDQSDLPKSFISDVPTTQKPERKNRRSIYRPFPALLTPS